MRGVAAIDVPTVKHWSYITSFIALANSTTKDVFYLRSITPAISLPKKRSRHFENHVKMDIQLRMANEPTELATGTLSNTETR